MCRRVIALTMVLSMVSWPAFAQDSVQIEATETIDLVAVAPRGARGETYLLDNLDLIADADLAALLGWQGASAHVHILNNLGGMPNDAAGTLQGINNIEVASQRLRLFEAWIEQRLGARTTVRAGLYDLNSEFYSNDASGLLLAPAFGVGSEIAATGTNGPSIFPSTALAVRVDQGLGDAGYARVALLNAAAGTLGDPQGVNLRFDQGALLIGEAGILGEGVKLSVGGWGYTRRHEDLADTDAAGDPLKRDAWGVYALAEARLSEREGAPAVSVFARAGISDGRTTVFKGGWQAGVLIGTIFAGREDAQLSFGVNQGYLSRGYRRLLADGGTRSLPAETAIELTYSDRLAPWLVVQPDIQLILNPGGEADRGRAWVTALRTTIEF